MHHRLVSAATASAEEEGDVPRGRHRYVPSVPVSPQHDESSTAELHQRWKHYQAISVSHIMFITMNMELQFVFSLV